MPQLQKVEASGTIYIRADGSVDPSTAPITRDGDVYTVTDNIYDGIVLERDNIVVNGNGYTVQGTGSYTFRLEAIGIVLSDRSNVTIKNVEIKNFTRGIALYSSYNNSVYGNTITNNDQGFYLTSSSNNSIRDNTITANRGGSFYLSDSSLYNTISGNNIENDIIFSLSSSNNIIFHNNFNNIVQVYSRGSVNIWDNGYPSGGNFWSDYAGVDSFSGQYQNITDSDAIGDAPYVIDADNRDRYPLMNALYRKCLSSLIFKDSRGASLYVNPSVVQVLAPNGSLVTFTSYSNLWLDFGTWTVKQIKWQGNNIKPADSTFVPMEGRTELSCRVYLIDFTNSFRNSTGYKLNPNPTSFRLICPNGTTTPPSAVKSYLLQNGTYTWKNIIWQGRDVTPATSQSFDPSNGNPAVNCDVVVALISSPFYILFLTQYSLPISFMLSISIVGVLVYRRRKKRVIPSIEIPKVEHEPVEIVGGYEPYGEFLKVGIKISNKSGSALINSSITLDNVPNALTFADSDKPYLKLGNIMPNEFQSAIYKLEPTRCVDGDIRGTFSYFDASGQRHTLEIPPIHIRNICPFLTSKGVVVADWMDMLGGGLLDSRSECFEFKGSPKAAFTLAEDRVRHLRLIERDERVVDDVYCGYCCYFGNARYGGYYFATTILVSGSETQGRLTLTVHSNHSDIFTGYYHEVLEDMRKHVETAQGITVITGQCPECGGELDPSKADEKGIITCSNCRCLNVIPPWMRIHQ